MDPVPAAPASASGAVDRDEDVYRACEEENAYTGTDEDTSMDPSIDDIDPRRRQFDSDMEDFVDTDMDEDYSMNELIDEVERMNEDDDHMMHLVDQLIEDIELEDLINDEKDSMDELNEEIELMNQFQIELARPIETTREESSGTDTDTETDEDDSTGGLDHDMFRVLKEMASSCLICRDFAQGIFRVDKERQSEYLSHHLCLSSLQRSIDDGCRLCMALAQSLEDFCRKSDPAVTQKESWSIKGVFSLDLDSVLHLSFCLCQSELEHPYGTICEDARTIHTFQFYPARKLGLGPEFLDSTLRTSSAKSATSIAVARSWYQQCLNHTTCRNWRQGSRVLPTRLVQIWRPDSQSTDLAAKICETKALPTSTPYVTLSHCWGKKGVRFKLEENNLQKLIQAIPIERLPKVFQDAIHVAYELGINYIWIDSLCIIQDSNEDWTSEAKRMGGVYLNGEFNIAATGYEDGLSGLFGERKAFSHVHIPMHMQCKMVDEEYKTKAVFEGIYVTASGGEFKRNVIFSPLNDRGWVAQERALSPAIIHYTPESMYWECNQCIASEAFQNGSHIWYETEGAGRDRIRSLSTRSEREEVYSFWRTFINRYAGMEMTFTKDRFPAVAGIARLLGELIDDNFLAGFWEGDIIRSLALDRHIAPRNAIIPEQLAPSWSWASINADTSMISGHVSQLEPLKGVRLLRVLSDIPGFKSDLHSPSFEKSGVRGLEIKGVLRKLPDDFDEHKGWVQSTYMKYDNKEAVEFLGDKLPEEQAWRSNDPTHMLILARQYIGSAQDLYIYGLLLQFAEVNEANTFRRSGTIELCFDTDEKCDEYLGLLEKDGEYEPSLFFEERGLQDLVLL